MSTTIYALCDPSVKDPVVRIRYIGKTRRRLGQRLCGHLWDAKCGGYHRAKWLRSIGGPPEIVSICVVDDSLADAEEIRQIAIHRKKGCKLVNGTDGGDGMGRPTPETLEKLRAAALALKGKRRPLEVVRRIRATKSTPEWRARFSAALKGRRLSPQHRANIGAALRGRKMTAAQRRKYRRAWTPERRAALSVARRGIRYSRETRRRISEGRRGIVLSVEARANLSAAAKKRPGRKHSEKTKAKMRAAALFRYRRPL